jgi:leucyl-tRNA synthetase
MEYAFGDTERKWQVYWSEEKSFRAAEDPALPKYYVLDMFPYPSGAGLHVGHPLGYIASDIVARYKRHRGYNVLHPMGYDSFGLPAEQYAIQTGQHPAVTTAANIARYREQMDRVGFSFDWDREVRTSDPSFYRWTQWIFLKLFQSWYNPATGRAEPLDTLLEKLQAGAVVPAEAPEGNWSTWNERQRSDVLMQYRLAYLSEAFVNWCPALGTVLANDEVRDGVSERGGHPVERKKMRQWSLRITAYAQRLLDDLEALDWSESIKEQQRNWIGRSEGASVHFPLEGRRETIEVFTTRPDTIFGATYMTLAPEHELVGVLTTDGQRAEVERYVAEAKNRSDRERMAEVKKITGVFTGAYAVNPFTNENIPVWVGDYVLAGYGTGAVMAVPAHDSRDHAFAKHFGLEIRQVIEAPEGWDIQAQSYDARDSRCIRSGFLDGKRGGDAIRAVIAEIEKRGLGRGSVQFKLRDAVFGRQRYWGEPIPVYYKDGIPHAVSENDLPVLLPDVDKYLPTEDGEPPLARAKDWKYQGKYDYEHTTMPGWAGSSWYALRYMDPHNDREFVSAAAVNYWKDVDLYIGGSEHATGHLLYVRFWTKFLFDLGRIPVQEPAKKLINQGMIQGMSQMIFRHREQKLFVSKEFAAGHEDDYSQIHVDISLVDPAGVLDLEGFLRWRPEYAAYAFRKNAEGNVRCATVVEKMSKSKYNVVNPDDVIDQHGADAFRMYEMFLGPLELSKPWNTNGITGVSGFIRKTWRLYHRDHAVDVSDAPAGRKELKSLHTLIKKVTDDIDRFSFNTSVSSFMICVNELTDLKCNKRSILEPLAVLLSPFAPHLAEELWSRLGHTGGIARVAWPAWNAEYLAEDSFAYPISVNGKTRLNLELALSLNKEEVERQVLSSEEVLRFLQGQLPKKVIVVPGRIVNIVV